jgi:hypothetical protein
MWLAVIYSFTPPIGFDQTNREIMIDGKKEGFKLSVLASG